MLLSLLVFGSCSLISGAPQAYQCRETPGETQPRQCKICVTGSLILPCSDDLIKYKTVAECRPNCEMDTELEFFWQCLPGRRLCEPCKVESGNCIETFPSFDSCYVNSRCGTPEGAYCDDVSGECRSCAKNREVCRGNVVKSTTIQRCKDNGCIPVRWFCDQQSEQCQRCLPESADGFLPQCPSSSNRFLSRSNCEQAKLACEITPVDVPKGSKFVCSSAVGKCVDCDGESPRTCPQFGAKFDTRDTCETQCSKFIEPPGPKLPLDSTDSPRACPINWELVGSACYLSLSEQLNARDAIFACQTKHPRAGLPVIRNQADWDDLVQWYNGFRKNNDWDIWIDGQDEQTEGSFSTFSDEKGNSCRIGFENWRPGRPGEDPGSNCILVEHFDGTDVFEMIDHNCAVTWPQVVCQIPMFTKCAGALPSVTTRPTEAVTTTFNPPTTTTETLQLPTSARDICPPEWAKVGSACYIPLGDQLNATEAIVACRAMHSYSALPIVRNRKEWDELTLWYNVLRENRSWDIWYCGQDREFEGIFLTFPGVHDLACEIPFANWRTGRPMENPEANCMLIEHTKDTNVFEMLDNSCAITWPQLVCQIPTFQPCGSGCIWPAQNVVIPPSGSVTRNGVTAECQVINDEDRLVIRP